MWLQSLIGRLVPPTDEERAYYAAETRRVAAETELLELKLEEQRAAANVKAISDAFELRREVIAWQKQFTEYVRDNEILVIGKIQCNFGSSLPNVRQARFIFDLFESEKIGLRTTAAEQPFFAEWFSKIHHLYPDPQSRIPMPPGTAAIDEHVDGRFSPHCVSPFNTLTFDQWSSRMQVARATNIYNHIVPWIDRKITTQTLLRLTPSIAIKGHEK